MRSAWSYAAPASPPRCRSSKRMLFVFGPLAVWGNCLIFWTPAHLFFLSFSAQTRLFFPLQYSNYGVLLGSRAAPALQGPHLPPGTGRGWPARSKWGVAWFTSLSHDFRSVLGACPLSEVGPRQASFWLGGPPGGRGGWMRPGLNPPPRDSGKFLCWHGTPPRAPQQNRLSEFLRWVGVPPFPFWSGSLPGAVLAWLLNPPPIQG